MSALAHGHLTVLKDLKREPHTYNQHLPPYAANVGFAYNVTSQLSDFFE